MLDVQPGTVMVWSDIGCPWAHTAVFRLHRARRRAGLEGRVSFDHRAFPLELFNRQPTPKVHLEAEIPVVGTLEPEAGWQLWQGQPHEYPVTTLLALEAVQAAKSQSPGASEALDRALRVAFFGQSRCISLLPVVLEVAQECAAVSVDALRRELENGSGRAAVMEQCRAAADSSVAGSPHLFLPDGTDSHNPGVKFHWEGDAPEGFPVVDDDDPSVYDDLVRRAAG
jgi:predicted DsbA family dithiol-disulfide isomerase